MKTLFIENEIKYIGSQLAPHWIYKNFKIQGDAIVAFVGECEVKLTEMVDIEDVINNEPIYSKYMLSFITEQFNVELVEGVFRQRLLVTCIKEALERRGFLLEETVMICLLMTKTVCVYRYQINDISFNTYRFEYFV